LKEQYKPVGAPDRAGHAAVLVAGTSDRDDDHTGILG